MQGGEGGRAHAACKAGGGGSCKEGGGANAGRRGGGLMQGGGEGSCKEGGRAHAKRGGEGGRGVSHACCPPAGHISAGPECGMVLRMVTNNLRQRQE